MHIENDTLRPVIRETLPVRYMRCLRKASHLYPTRRLFLTLHFTISVPPHRLLTKVGLIQPASSVSLELSSRLCRRISCLLEELVEEEAVGAEAEEPHVS